ncbi:hypothetical protein L208DRAFT_1499192 [Tricholoma matsutake]|nr:hypothetical protein L208DRAFT_1499192 [Tricholoma matsutake 945]
MVVVLWPEFMQEAVQYPTPEEKEEAKKWVAKCSCKAWHGVWFGESYFDWKCQYSLSFQIILLPNLCIIDFTYGHTSSTHDSTAWEQTKLAQSHNKLLEEGEWVWADSVYPVHSISIQIWVVAPYKKPEHDLPDNEVYYKHVSMLQIHSEHAIGFLKG